MSQRRFLNKKQKKAFKQMPHSQKFSVSAKESDVCIKEIARLTKQLHKKYVQREELQKQADRNWKKAIQLQAQGRIGQATEYKTYYEYDANRVKCMQKRIKKLKEQIDSCSNTIRLSVQKTKINYATMKVLEPPSDNQE